MHIKGNKQKIQFIVSVLHDPDLIILDEPFSGLDPISVEEIKNAVIKLRNQGKTIIFSSHRMDHVSELCESVIIMDKGKAILQGNIKDLEEKLKNLNVLCDIKNEARVHIWYNPKYGTNREPYVSSEDAISSWGSTVTCIACRLENGKFKFCCPYGLDDLFNLTIRPVKRYFQKEQYEERSLRWKKKWNKLNIIEW